MTAKICIKIQCLDTVLLATTAVKIMYVIFKIFPPNTLTEPLNLLNQFPFLQTPINKIQ